MRFEPLKTMRDESLVRKNPIHKFTYTNILSDEKNYYAFSFDLFIHSKSYISRNL